MRILQGLLRESNGIIAVPYQALSKIKRPTFARRRSTNPISFLSRTPPSFPSKIAPNLSSHSICPRRLPRLLLQL